MDDELIDRTNALLAIQELHRMVPCEPGCCDEGLCWTCADTYPCPTRKLADEALGEVK